MAEEVKEMRRREREKKVMSILSLEEGYSTSHIRRKSGYGKPVLSRTLGRLKEAGLIDSVPKGNGVYWIRLI